MKFKISIVLVLFSSFLYAQEDNYLIPEDEFQISRLINNIENEIKELEELKEKGNLILSLISSTQQNFNKIEVEKIDFTNYKSLQNRNIQREFDALTRGSRLNPDDFKNPELKAIVNQNRLLFYQFFDVFDEDYFGTMNLETVKKIVTRIEKAQSSLIERLNTLLINTQEKIKARELYLKKLYNNKGKNTNLHRTAIMMGLPAFCITILLLFLIPYFLERKNTVKLAEDETQQASGKQYLLDVATVLLLTMTILILGLAKMITGEVLGTLLGGISGYVLNRSMHGTSPN